MKEDNTKITDILVNKIGLEESEITSLMPILPKTSELILWIMLN
jgi:hypothetical protein